MGSEFASVLKKRLFSGGAWALVGRGGNAMLALVINALLARLLTPEELGSYFLTLSIVSVGITASQLGLNQAIVRLIAEAMGTNRTGRAMGAVRAVLAYGLLGVLIVSVLLLGGVGEWLALKIFESNLIFDVIGLAVIWLFARTLSSLLGEIFRGFQDIRSATIFSQFLTSLLSAIAFGILWLFQGHSDLSLVIIASISAGFTSNLIAGWFLWKKAKKLGRAEPIEHRELFDLAWPLWLTGLMLFAFTEADILILGIYYPETEVAVYGAALRLANLAGMSLMIVNAVISPFVAELYSQNMMQELERVIRVSATLASLPAISAFILYILFGDVILGLIYGELYRNSESILIILSFGQLINVVTGSCVLLMNMTGFHKQSMFMVMGVGLIALALFFVIIPDYGVEGAAVVNATAISVTALLAMTYAYIKINIRTWLLVGWSSM